MVAIRQLLVPEDKAYAITYGRGNTIKKICIHETDNTSPTADADAHARLQFNGNSREASWHWQVDDKEAVQSFEHSWKCWAAGQGNYEAIHIEICVNGNYRKAVQNASELVAHILRQEKHLSIDDVVQHNYYTGKNCPRNMRQGNVVGWSSFKQMIKANLETGGGYTLEFGRPTSKEIYESRVASPATKKLLVEEAVTVLGYKKDWQTLHAEGKLKEGDYNALAYELAVHYAKQ